MRIQGKSVYVRSMGKLLEVTFICSTDDEANKVMEKDDSQAVVADFGNLVFLALKWDKGINIERGQ